MSTVADFIEACLRADIKLATKIKEQNPNIDLSPSFCFSKAPLRHLTVEQQTEDPDYFISTPVDLLKAVKVETLDDPLSINFIYEMFPETRNADFIKVVRDHKYPHMELQYIDDVDNLKGYVFLPTLNWKQLQFDSEEAETVRWDDADLDVYFGSDDDGCFIKVMQDSKVIFYYNDCNYLLQTGDASCMVFSCHINCSYYLQVINQGDVESMILLQWSPAA